MSLYSTAVPKPLHPNPKLTIPNLDEGATVLGEAQWARFERRLREPAEIRVVFSSIQLVTTEHGSEKWENCPRERARFLELLRRTQAQGVAINEKLRCDDGR